MTELPPGWAMSSIGELTDTSLGKMLDAKQATGHHPTPYLRNVNVRWGTFDLSDLATMDIRPAELERVLARVGDVIACEGGEPGRAAVWRRAEPIALQKALHRVRTGPAVCPDFLALLLRHQAESGELSRLFTGTTIKHLPQEKLRLVRVPVAPPAEQERIVVAIEEAFSKLDAGEAALRTARQRLKRMRDAVLTAAVTGRLVPQDPTDTPVTELLAQAGASALHRAGLDDLPLSWRWIRLGDMCRVSVGTTPSRADRTLWGGGVPWVSSGEVAFNRIRHTRETISAAAIAGRPDRLLPRGTVMLAMIGEGRTRGQPAVLEIEAAHNQNCASIRVADAPIASAWLYTVLAARYERTRQSGAGNNQPALNKSLVEAIEVPLAPPDEQLRVVAEVEWQFSFIEACERAVDAGLARSAALRRSVLKAAFEGRLVPHDPSDEPASVLLERIRAGRAASGSPKLRRTRPVRSGS